jgi:hypothetical protein
MQIYEHIYGKKMFASRKLRVHDAIHFHDSFYFPKVLATQSLAIMSCAACCSTFDLDCLFHYNITPSMRHEQ